MDKSAPVLSREQTVQESMYTFPYHYIPHLDDAAFSQSRVLDWGYEYLSYLGFVIDLLKNYPFQKLLDIGCGDGRFLHELRCAFPDAGLDGLDYSDRALLFARAFNPGINFRCEDVKQKKDSEDLFDIVTLIETLEHLPLSVIPEFLQGVSRYIHPNGLLLITVPSMNIPVSPKHYQHFDLESLQNTVAPCFHIEKCIYLNRISSVVRWVNRLSSNKVFLIRERHILRWLYSRYVKRYLPAEKENAGRLCVICRKPETIPPEKT